MSERTGAHFDEEAAMRWQMGEATEAERAHVAACTECQTQTRPLADALSWCGAAARQWGEEKATAAQECTEAKAAAGQEWRESKAIAAWSRRSMLAAWAMVSVVLLLVFGIGLPRWKAHRAAMMAQLQQQHQQEEKQELARDNTLLEAVDQDVSQVVPEAMQALSWNAANSNAAGTAEGPASRQ